MNAPQRLTDRKRLAIIDAAITEFRANGFEATSMDKIAATAGVSKRTVYNHFPGKDELFSEIMLQLWGAIAEQLDIPYVASEALRPQLIRLVTQKIKMLSEKNFLDLMRVAIAETIHSPERAQAVVKKLGEREEGVTRWIRSAMEDGKLKPSDPVFAANLLHGQVKGFAFWPQVTMGAPLLPPEQQQAVTEAAVDMFLAYFAK